MFSIRAKLLLLSIAVLSIPYIGLEYLRELERYLRDSLEISLIDATKATAGPLQGRGDLFPLHDPEEPRSLYVHSLNLPVQLDGYTDEWLDYLGWSDIYTDDNSAQSFRLLANHDEQYYYVLLQVSDKDVIYQNTASPDLLNSDHVQMVISDRYDQAVDYYFSPTAPGPGRPFSYKSQISEFGFEQQVLEYTNNIDSVWQPTDTGYTLEIAIPKYMINKRLGFIVHDVDTKSSGEIFASLGTAGDKTGRRPGRLLQASNVIKEIIDQHASSQGRRAWVLDDRGQVLATNGNLNGNINNDPVNILYRLILPSVYDRFSDDLEGASRLQGAEVLNALKGNIDNRWRTTPDGRAVIISSATPVWVDNIVRGVVVIEETTNSIQMLQRKAMASLFNKTILVFSIVTLLLLAFATRLSFRLRKLSNEAEAAIDMHGRVVDIFTASKASDEIGELSRNYSAMLDRLKQYNDYLEGMSGRLSHELRTPIAVVQSSLEHLNSDDVNDNQEVYAERAKEGIDRLNLIVTRLSEATRIEQVLQNTEMVETNINELFTHCIQGYELAFPEKKFNLKLPDNPFTEDIVPDLIVQMMDKLVKNAIDFSNEETPVNITISKDKNGWDLSVMNYGVLLPETMEDQIFNSMVSIRDRKKKEEPHLGLGLYLVRLIAEFHHARVFARNTEDKTGVVFQVSFPSK